MSRTIKKIVIHCSDSPDDLDFGLKDINQWHKERGFISPSGIHCGYHYVVRRDGRVEQGRPEHEAGAHVKGHNSDSIGVVWIGRKHPTEQQLDALYRTVAGLMKKYSVPIDKVYGHYELDSGKTCPNLQMDLVRAELLFIKSEA